MKKKLQKRLVLNKETIRNLQIGEMSPVAGVGTADGSCIYDTCLRPTNHWVTCATCNCPEP